MKKIIIVIIIIFFILSNFGISASSDDNIKHDKYLFSFSNISVQEFKDELTLELQGTNSIFFKNNYYILPKIVKTYYYPFGTKIDSIDIVCSDMQKEILNKKIKAAPSPIYNKFFPNEKLNFNENPNNIESSFNSKIGAGIYNNKRCLIVNIEIYPIQYNPDENLIKWPNNIEITINYSNPNYQTSTKDEYTFLKH